MRRNAYLELAFRHWTNPSYPWSEVETVPPIGNGIDTISAGRRGLPRTMGWVKGVYEANIVDDGGRNPAFLLLFRSLGGYRKICSTGTSPGVFVMFLSNRFHGNRQWTENFAETYCSSG